MASVPKTRRQHDTPSTANSRSPISLFSPGRIWRKYRRETEAALHRVLESGVLILGEEVRLFEKEFAAYVGAHDAVGVSSGTDALILALHALNIGQGDEVVTVANGPVPTAAAIQAVGAIPRFADIDLRTLQISPKSFASSINSRTRAVIVVHLYGHSAPIDEIVAVVSKKNVAIIEDCAQGHGTCWNGKHVGTFGKVGCFSFYPTKNLGAFGDAGLCISKDPAITESIRSLAQYGYHGRERIAVRRGYNARMDELQAAFLRFRLKDLEAGLQRRRWIADLYRRAIDGERLICPSLVEGGKPAWHQFVVRTYQRKRFQCFMLDHGIQTGIHYPVPVHRMPAFAELECKEICLPNTELACQEVVSLPIYPELTDDEVKRVVSAVRKFVRTDSCVSET